MSFFKIFRIDGKKRGKYLKKKKVPALCTVIFVPVRLIKTKMNKNATNKENPTNQPRPQNLSIKLYEFYNEHIVNGWFLFLFFSFETAV